MTVRYDAPRAPIWLERNIVEAMHDDVLASHGGLGGVRDVGLLESALAKPQQLHAYDEASDLADWAAAYAVGIARNHPFLDGNKRTAFVSMAVFLRMNGVALNVPEPEGVLVAIDIATGAMPAPDVAAWIRRNTTPILSSSRVVRETRKPRKGTRPRRTA